MPVVLYEIAPSPSCRAVIMTARLLGVKLEKKTIDMKIKDNLKTEFSKINPQRTVPTIVDDGFILWEGHAIMKYLVNKYAPDHSLYPKDHEKRATVDRVLYFDIGILHPAIQSITKHLFYEIRDPSTEQLEELKMLEEMLEKTSYAAGDHMTLADISILATLSMAEIVNVKFDEYPKLSAWMKKLKKEIPDYAEINDKSVQELKDEAALNLAILKKCFNK